MASLTSNPSDSSLGASDDITENRTPSIPSLLLVVFQLLLAVLVVRLFEIEARRQLYPLMVLVLLGFLVHVRLPEKWQPMWFVGLSVIGMFLLLGWPAAAIVIGICTAMIGACFLPIGYWGRVLLLVMMGTGLVWWRSTSTSSLWPIVGSLFMFRLIVFLFETRHARTRQPFWSTVSYFLLLPNLFFVLFPVVDYTTFLRTRTKNDAETALARQTGVNWIVLGLLHLLMYRAIRYWILPAPLTIQDAATLLQFLAANYGLYLHISGQFHLVIGVLHLFGFNLPRTHDWYFLASSFTDIWRRINIYWKDFMSKVFFMPAYFRLRRRWGDQPALFVAVCGVFVATWLAHSWQVFWLLGEFPFAWLDAQLWLGAGLVVATNSLLDFRTARQEPARESLTLSATARRSAKTVGIFLLVCVFWARWTNPELLQLLAGFGPERFIAPEQLMIVAAILSSLVAGGIVLQFVLQWLGGTRLRPIAITGPNRVLANSLVLMSLLVLTLPALQSRAGKEAGRVIAAFQTDKFTKTESSRLVQGYYEELNEGSLQAGLWSDRPGIDPAHREWGKHYDEVTYPRTDLLEMELVPGWTGDLAGVRFTVNQWGMRDREIDKTKPPGTLRIGLLGSSIIMGYGVADDDVLGRVLERELNAAPKPAGVERFEVLNFAQGRYGAIHRRLWLEERGFEFDLDVVLYFSHQDELIMPVSHLSLVAPSKVPIEDPCLRDVLKQAGLENETSYGLMRTKLPPYAFELIRCSYERIVNDCHEREIVPVWVDLPIPGNFELPIDPADVRDVAEEAGFLIMDLNNWADGYAPGDVKIDIHHLNQTGHRIVAERVLEELRQHPEFLRFRTAVSRGSP